MKKGVKHRFSKNWYQRIDIQVVKLLQYLLLPLQTKETLVKLYTHYDFNCV